MKFKWISELSKIVWVIGWNSVWIIVFEIWNNLKFPENKFKAENVESRSVATNLLEQWLTNYQKIMDILDHVKEEKSFIRNLHCKRIELFDALFEFIANESISEIYLFFGLCK